MTQTAAVDVGLSLDSQEGQQGRELLTFLTV